jgi:hypothetical protein
VLFELFAAIFKDKKVLKSLLASNCKINLQIPQNVGSSGNKNQHVLNLV